MLYAFRPREKGLRKVFGGLEAEVMEVLWRRSQATVGEVLEELRRHREIAYTTVKTVMGRLAKKGYLTKQGGEKAHIFEPTRSREQFLQEVGREVLEALFTEFGEPVLIYLVEVAKEQDEALLDRLQALIEKAKKVSPRGIDHAL